MSDKLRCPSCGGNCSDYPDTEKACPECGGNGYYVAEEPTTSRGIPDFVGDRSAVTQSAPAMCDTLVKINGRWVSCTLPAGHPLPHSVPGPEPATTSEVLTRERLLSILDYWLHDDAVMGPTHAAKILAHDAALRAEVERLRKEKAEDACENGHHKHEECTEACSCVGAGKSRIEKAEARADAAEAALKKYDTLAERLNAEIRDAREARDAAEAALKKAEEERDEAMKKANGLQVSAHSYRQRAQNAEQTLADTRAVPTQEPSEDTCMRCGRVHATVWSAPSGVWNAVMRSPDGKGEERFGFCCPTCFMQLTDAAGLAPVGFSVAPSSGDYCAACRSNHPPCDAAEARAAELEVALAEAANSLEVLSRAGSREAGEYLADLIDVRGYAVSRARVARAAAVLEEKP